MNLHNTVAVVTGAGNGIGRSCAIEFARRGADVVIADIDEAGSEVTAKEVQALGRKALVEPTDLGDNPAVHSLVEKSIAWQGHVDVLHANAAIAVGGPPHLIPDSDWDAAMRINLLSAIWSAQAVLPHMFERGSGSLVFTSSPAGLRGVPYLSPYVVTKYAQIGWAESLAPYCKAKGINVSIAMPGYAIATDVTRNGRITYEGDIDEETMRNIAGTAWHMIGVAPSVFAAAIVAGVERDAFYICDPPSANDPGITKYQDPDAWLAEATKDVLAGGFGSDPLITSALTAEKLAKFA